MPVSVPYFWIYFLKKFTHSEKEVAKAVKKTRKDSPFMCMLICLVLRSFHSFLKERQNSRVSQVSSFCDTPIVKCKDDVRNTSNFLSCLNIRMASRSKKTLFFLQCSAHPMDLRNLKRTEYIF
jgi:hypothetical protein